VLLQPPQERRETGPAADRDDPRTTCQEPLLVDHLDERGVSVARPERIHQYLDHLHRPEREQRHPERGEERAPDHVREELERDDVQDRHERALDLDVPVHLAKEERQRECESELAYVQDVEPETDSLPGP
jgi:hypothetical protein